MLSTFIHCVNCGEVKNDKITIKINEETGQFREIFKVGIEDGRIRDNEWIHNEIDFTVETANFQVRKDSFKLL